MIPLEDVAVRILALAGESPDKTIPGGRLSELLKHHFPGFTSADYGAKNLRAFIRDHLPGKISEVGKVGADIVYGLPGGVPPQTRPQNTIVASITKDVDRVFRSPNAPFELHANRETGVIRVRDVGTPIQEPWVRIKRASPEELWQIAKDFVSEVPHPDRAQLISVLDEGPNAWWPKFSIYVQEKKLYGQWVAFKHKCLRSQLETALRNLGVMRSGTFESTVDVENRPREFSRCGDEAPLSDDFRDAVVKVVQGLSLSELRNLKLPVGDVYDALKHRR